ncbi:MAG: hypothetical protein LW832_09525 [Parachlamydia sp.]|nr:hypothetical protein [Parachlamydia sp.]
MLGSVFGGALAGFYLLSKNYSAMGHELLAKKTLRAGFTSFLFFLLCLAYTPDMATDHSIPFLLLAQPLLGGSYILFEHYKVFYQKNFIKKILAYLLPTLSFLFIAPFYIPAEWIAQLPTTSQILMPAGIILSFYYSLQWEHLKNKIKGNKGSNWKLFGIALMGIILQLSIAFIAFSLL